MSRQIRLKFESVESTSPIELSLFLQLFVTTYRALEKIHGDRPPGELEPLVPKGGFFGSLDFKDIKWCLDDTMYENDPKIISIKQQSPIEIVIVGGILLFFLAATLSGGNQKIDLGPIKFEFNLTSLGDSIIKLRSALASNASLQTGYTFMGGKIRLNKEEAKYLFKPVNRNGGFQRFLGELQIRLNRQTKEIELSNRDIEKILQYKTDPSKGGFQSRFNKIFRRHFP